MQLINNTVELKKILGGVQQNMDDSTWKPFIKSAEENYIIPAIGRAFYLQISELQTNVNLVLVREKLAEAVAKYAYLISIPKMTAMMGDNGIVQASLPNTAVMPKWMNVNLVTASRRDADNALDIALWLMESLVDEKDSNDVLILKKWLDSDVYAKSHDLLIVNSSELTRRLPVCANSRRFYMALVDYMREVEDDFLAGVVGEETVEKFRFASANNINSSNAADTFLAFQKATKYAGYIVANRALCNALPFLNVSEDFRLVSSTDGVTNDDICDSQTKNQMLIACKENVEKYVMKLKKHLNHVASSDIFNEYFESEHFEKRKEQSDGRGRFGRVNDDSGRNYLIV